jgi:hypothetical protein
MPHFNASQFENIVSSFYEDALAAAPGFAGAVAFRPL